MAKRLGITRQYYNALEGGHKEPSKTLVATLDFLANEVGGHVASVDSRMSTSGTYDQPNEPNREVANSEDQAAYGCKRKLKRNRQDGMQIAHNYRLPKEIQSGKRPSRDEIEYALVEYLDAAEHWEAGDGLSVAWMEILKHLRSGDFVNSTSRKASE